MAKNINWKNVLVLAIVLLIGFGIGSIGMFKIISKKLISHNIEVFLWK